MIRKYLSWCLLPEKARNYLKYLERSQWFSQDELEKIQLKKLSALLNYAYYNVPFYHRIYKANGVHPSDLRELDDITKFPVISKSDFKKVFPKECLGKTYGPKDVVYGQTSGSTGNPLGMFVGKDKMYVRQASKLRFDRWAGLNPGERFVLFWFPGYKKRLISKIKQKVDDVLSNRLSVGIRYIDECKIMTEIKRLQRFKAKIFRGYPQFLYIFAKYISENNINGIKPSAVISEGFLLLNGVRNYIEEVFGCKVSNHYGSVEITSIAQECSEHVGLHINAENRFVEILKDGEVASSGERGEIVVTDLENYAMPFIRYRMEDIATPTDETCACGRGLPLIKNIEGRIFDFILYKGKMFYPPHTIFYSPQYLKSIHNYQIIQNSPDEIEINLVADNELNIDPIMKVFTESFPDMKISINFVSSIAPAPGGKHRFVYSKIAVN